jgi:hypothetical protein
MTEDYKSITGSPRPGVYNNIKTILVCGDRNWSDDYKIRKELIKYSKFNPAIIHGGCRGADTIAGYVGFSLGMREFVYKADWKKFGRGAGPKRNERMLIEGKPDLILAFHSNLEESKGTKDMVTRGTKAGVKTVVIS